MSTGFRPQRQSPWAIVFFALRLVGSVGGIQVAVAIFLVVTGSVDTRLLIIAPFVGALVLGAAALSWWRFTFCVVDDEFVVRSGVLRLDRLSVPIDRIQSISTEQQLIHRLVGVVRIQLDTAGSEDTEFELHAVSQDVADDLRRRTGRLGPTSDTPTATEAEHHRAPVAGAEPPIVAHSSGRLVAAALTSWPFAGLVVLGPLVAAAGQLGEDLPVRPPEIDGDQFRWWWIPLFVAGGLAALIVMNVLRILLRDWNHTVQLDGDQLRRTSGLLSRRLDTRAISKVQVVTTSTNPLQAAAGLSEVEVSSIGDGGLDVLGCDPGEYAAIVRRTNSTPIDELAPSRRIDPAEIGRAVRLTALAVAGFVAVTVWTIGWWSALAALAIPVVWIRRRRHVRFFRWTLTHDELATSGRIVDAWTEQTLLRKANGVRVRRTWFERRRGLATLHLQTAAGDIAIGMLPVGDATALRDRILARVLTDDRPWM